jgi:hypothetical protein
MILRNRFTVLFSDGDLLRLRDMATAQRRTPSDIIRLLLASEFDRMGIHPPAPAPAPVEVEHESL